MVDSSPQSRGLASLIIESSLILDLHVEDSSDHHVLLFFRSQLLAIDFGIRLGSVLIRPASLGDDYWKASRSVVSLAPQDLLWNPGKVGHFVESCW